MITLLRIKNNMTQSDNQTVWSYRALFTLLVLSVLFFWAAEGFAQKSSIQGRVVGVSDGDTITVLTAQNQQYRIRLDEIDAPESSQPFGRRSKEILSDLVFGKSVTVQVGGKDRYDRLTGKVFLQDQDINRAMVSKGAAWVYTKYLKDKSLIADERIARSNRIGLWGMESSQIVPPWEWRMHQNQRSPVRDLQGDTSSQLSAACSEKSSCKTIASCSQAKHLLSVCGHSHLDRDGDGIPCESLCR